MKTIRNIIKASLLPVANYAAKAYIAGPELSDAIRKSIKFSQLKSGEINSTIGFWNSEEHSPEYIANQCIESIESASKLTEDCYISIKAPALKFDKDRIMSIVEKGKEFNIGIHYDSHGMETTDPTFELVAESVSRYSKVGCTLPGRWKRSVSDADQIAALGVNVRVVKGQWEDPNWPDADMRSGYLDVINALAGKARRVAVATHDHQLARNAIRILSDAGTPCHLELLVGLPMKASLKLARDLNIQTRVYIPYGKAWLPYALAQIKNKPQILLWVMRDTLFGSV